MKVCAFEMEAGKKVELIPECHSLIDELSASHSTDLQQRAYELQALLGLEADTVGCVMPLDASCEDIEVDKNLTFLNGYVQSSLEKGARPYIPESERGNMGSVNTFRPHQDLSEGVGHSLRFEAYEIPKAPVPSRAIQVSSLASNEFEVVTDSNYARAMQLSAPVPSPANAEISNSDGLKLRLDGVQKKWGRPTYTSTSAASASSGNIDKSNNGAHVSALGEATSMQNRESSYESRHMDRRQQTEVSAEKQKLAASLFGSSSSKTDKRASSTKVSKTVEKKSNHAHPEKIQTQTAASAPNRVETQPENVTVTPPPDLLDLSEEVPAVKASYDPFKQLEGLLEGTPESAPGKPAASVASSPPVDLMSMYGGVSLGPTSSSAPVVSNILGNDLLGGDPVMQTGLSNLNAQSISGQSIPSVKKGNLPRIHYIKMQYLDRLE